MQQPFRCTECGSLSGAATRCESCGAGSFELVRSTVTREAPVGRGAELHSLHAARVQRDRRAAGDRD